jgi:hypothetical protein
VPNQTASISSARYTPLRGKVIPSCLSSSVEQINASSLSCESLSVRLHLFFFYLIIFLSILQRMRKQCGVTDGCNVLVPAPSYPSDMRSNSCLRRLRVHILFLNSLVSLPVNVSVIEQCLFFIRLVGSSLQGKASVTLIGASDNTSQRPRGSVRVHKPNPTTTCVNCFLTSPVAYPGRTNSLTPMSQYSSVLITSPDL